jgi:hypothetical protein
MKIPFWTQIPLFIGLLFNMFSIFGNNELAGYMFNGCAGLSGVFVGLYLLFGKNHKIEGQ